MNLNLLDVECLLTACKNAKAEFLDDEIMEKNEIWDILHLEEFTSDVYGHFIAENLVWLLLGDEPMLIEFEFESEL